MTNLSVAPPATRPVVMGVNGMVASGHPLASMVGLRVLTEGGNAFDAAVAVAATLNVVEPMMSGVGGIGVALAYVGRERRVRALDFSGRSPKAADPSRFTEESKETGLLSALVPGDVAGWLTLHDAYGSIDLERLFQPAISYAEDGFPVTPISSRLVSRSFAGLVGGEARLARFPTSASIILREGRAPTPGSRLRMPQLADSLRKIARGGQDAFYRGELAHRIVKAGKELGSILTEDDFAEYRAEWKDPIHIDYRGHEVYTTPPNSSGFQVLQTLKLLEGFGDADLVYQHPSSLHLQMEAVKLCVTDRIKYGGDPDYVDIPLRGLLSDRYAAGQRGRVDRGKASVVAGEHYSRIKPPGALTPGSPEEFDGGMTTHFATADRDGNVVSVTQTLGGAFGSAVAVGDTGIFMNNMAFWFDLEEGSPNCIGPWKRVDFVCAPTHTLKDGRFVLSVGTPGSWGILQTTPQFLMNILDFGLDVQQAIEAPLFRYFTGRRVEMEERFPTHVRDALRDMGHEVVTTEPWAPGISAQAIRFDAREGVLHGASDPRRDGIAAGW